ncbi:ATP-binding cassette domain-containing protein [Brevibacterium album]|uniref:ATP-binding cassette domain-containing protein n=1 Tax=Brevibacterium album TaxID=417948 RepID=UPI000419B3DB|nr:ATP-binding cassette domain-containing protein [Brevibacterium album]
MEHIHAPSRIHAGSPAITAAHLSFAWPDGSAASRAHGTGGVIDDQTLTIPAGLIGMIGANGAGKTTFARLLAGELQPISGRIDAGGPVWVLPQDLPQQDRTVAEVLGISDTLAALRRVLSGEAGEAQIAADMEAIGEDWDIEERALAALASVGLASAGLASTAPDPASAEQAPSLLDRRMSSLSGGQAMRAGLAGAVLAGAAWTILDEPTNNLDSAGRSALFSALEALRGGVLAISHDRELLERVDAVVELRHGRLRVFGGTFGEYEAALEVEQAAARADVAQAKSAQQLERRQRIEAEQKLARRERYGKKMEANKREPKIIMGLRKREAQVSAAKLRGMVADREAAAEAELETARERVREQVDIRLSLPDTEVPARRRVLEVEAACGECALVGPARVRLEGANGSGKSTLLRAIVAASEAAAGERAREAASGGSCADDPIRLLERAPRADGRTWTLRPRVPTAYLSQSAELPEEETAEAAVRIAAPEAGPHEVRAMLAALELRGSAAQRRCGDLSGGERLRVALAGMLLRRPAPQLLLLDEPTNSLDLDSVRVLVSALEDFRGALLVVTHDPAFARDLGLEEEWVMETMREGAGETRAGADAVETAE